MNRRNKKQLRVDENTAKTAESVHRRYNLLNNKNVPWCAFGNMLIQMGVDALSADISKQNPTV